MAEKLNALTALKLAKETGIRISPDPDYFNYAYNAHAKRFDIYKANGEFVDELISIPIWDIIDSTGNFVEWHTITP